MVSEPHPRRERRVGHPAERAVDRGQQVEGAEQGDDRDGGAPGADAVGVGVVAHEHVRQAHRAEAEGEHRGCRAVGRVVVGAGGGQRDVPRRVDLRRGRPRPEPQGEQHERGHGQGGELDPVLHGLHEGDRPHAAGADGQGDDDHDDEPTDPGRGAGDEGQGQARALELRHEVEPADADDEQRRDEPDGARPEPGLGEVGQRVGARAAHRGGHDDEQHEVAQGVADRQPQHVDALVVDQPGDAEKACGGEVLAADRRRVEARRDGAPGDVEVARAPRQPQPERPTTRVVRQTRATAMIDSV